VPAFFEERVPQSDEDDIISAFFVPFFFAMIFPLSSVRSVLHGACHPSSLLPFFPLAETLSTIALSGGIM
jgi:hypothetical protein